LKRRTGTIVRRSSSLIESVYASVAMMTTGALTLPCGVSMFQDPVRRTRRSAGLWV